MNSSAMPRRQSAAQMQAACDKFNAKFPVGAAILCWPLSTGVPPIERRVRHPAQILNGHTAVVYVEDGGCIALSHVKGAP